MMDVQTIGRSPAIEVVKAVPLRQEILERAFRGNERRTRRLEASGQSADAERWLE